MIADPHPDSATLFSAIDALRDSIAVVDHRGIIIHVNRTWQNFADANGGSSKLAAGVGIDYLATLRTAAPQDQLIATILAGLENVLSGRDPLFTMEYPCNSPTSQHWFELQATRLQGSFVGLVISHHEITARKLAEHELDARTTELRRSQRDLAALMDHVPSMLGYWDSNCRNRFANQAYRDWFGLEPEAIPGKHIREVLGETLYQANLPYIEGALRGQPQQFERDIPSANGGLMRHSLARYLPDIVNGVVQGFYAEVTDVTTLKIGEQALQRAQEIGRLGSYVGDIAAGVWQSSQMLDQILGVGPGVERSIESWGRLIHPDDHPVLLMHAAKAVGEGSRFDTQFRIIRPNDGQMRWLHGFGEFEYSSDGTPLRVVGTIQDITERKLAELSTQLLLDENTRLLRQLIVVQEQERANLARELHDELSQHLTAIRAYAGAIERDTSQPNDRIKSATHAIEECARDIYQVSHRLMEGLRPNALDAAGIVDALGSLLDGWGQQNPEIEWRASLDRQLICRAEQVRVAIYRIVQECLNNITRHARAQRVRLVLSSHRKNGVVSVRLLIRDDGIGMNLEERHSGFGLLGIRERVLSLGGTLQLDSSPGAGMRIRVNLPNP